MKSENRNPKSEGNSNTKNQKGKTEAFLGFGFFD
jgi:hypothetical protein